MQTAGWDTRNKGPVLYAAVVKTKDGRKQTLIGTFNDCLAFLHEKGRTVKKARIRVLD